MYNLKVSPSEEIDVPIKDIYLYPVRGIMGIKVEVAEVNPYGLKNDR